MNTQFQAKNLVVRGNKENNDFCDAHNDAADR